MSEKKEKGQFSLVLTVAFLITGNLVGAGILGLPVNTGIDGFIPSLIAMLVLGSVMFFTAVVLGREAVEKEEESFNYPSLYQHYLGSAGKWVAILANMLILYGLLVAYLAGATTIITELFGMEKFYILVLLIVFLALTLLTLMGMNMIRKYNVLLMLLLWGAFAVIVCMGETHVQPKRLLSTEWEFLPFALPVIVTSFHFHNIIPNVCKGLNWKMSTIWKAMLAGMIIGYVMNAIWIQVGVGALPLEGGSDSLVYAFKNNLPATVPMAGIVENKAFTIFSMLFALLAIMTSYIANGLGLMGFNQDLVINFFKKPSHWLVVTLTFAPPLIIAVIFPNIFIKCINLVGGVGIVLLFGILPCIISFVKTKSYIWKIISVIILLLFAAIFLFQSADELGFIKSAPVLGKIAEKEAQKSKISNRKPVLKATP